VPESRRVILAVIAIVFLAITTATWAGVTGPGTTGGEQNVTEPGPAPTAPELAPEAPEPPPTEAPEPPTTEVPEPPPFEEAARDLGERGAKPAPKAERARPEAAKQDSGGNADWKAAKKAAKAECKRRYTGRARGQCVSAAAREHRNPKARGRR